MTKIIDPKCFMLLNKKNVLPPITIVLVLFFFLGLLYDFFTPLWNPPDEERHFAYCEYIAQKHKLPVYRADPEDNMVSMAFHPPLYYIIGSLLFNNDRGLLEEEIDINDGPGFNRIIPPKNKTEAPYAGKSRTAHLLRILSLIINWITLYLIYRTALMLFIDNRAIASFAVLFVATLPQFLHVSASISNENLSTMLSAAYLLALLYFLKNPRQLRYQVISGIMLGLCLLSKTSALFYLPVTICFICWLSAREKTNPISPLSIILGTASLVGGWWYFQNWFFFNDPTLSKTVMTLNPWHLRNSPLSLSEVMQIASKTLSTFFGGFGTMQVPLPVYHLAFYGLIIGAGCAGLYINLRSKLMNTFQKKVLVLFLLIIIGGVGIYTYINIKYSGFFLGRYLFIIVSPIATLISAGLYCIPPLRVRGTVMLFIACLLVIMNFNLIVTILKPAYADTHLAKGEDQQYFAYPTPEINGNTKIGQTFIAQQNNLCSIRAMFSNSNNNYKKEGNLIFVLTESGGGKKILQQIEYPLNQIEDFTRYFFVFPPIADSLGKKYEFSFEVPSKISDSGIALWYETTNCSAAGQLLINNKTVPGTLCFTAYHFIGDVPRTDWQGISATVIRQGWYITLPELQLYNERSKAFRCKTATHEKMIRFDKALNNRKVQAQKH